MTSVLHVLGPEVGEHDLIALRTLLDARPMGDAAHVVALDARVARLATERLDRVIDCVPQRWRSGWSVAPELRRRCDRGGAELVHGWGAGAIGATLSSARGRRVLIGGTRFDDAECVARWAGQANPPAAIVVTHQVHRGRLAGYGVAPDRIAVIRGPVDFSRINDARKRGVRRQWLGDASPVIFITGAATRADGVFEAAWATVMLQRIFPRLRVILPGDSPETRRVRRMFAASQVPDMPVPLPPSLTWAELVASADLFVASPAEQTPTEPIAWAMAAGLGIVGSAVRSVAELIADHSNGLLCRTNEPRLLAAAMLQLLEDEPLRLRLADVARGQAYEVFSQRAFVENYRALYSNIMGGIAIDKEVRDTAMVA